MFRRRMMGVCCTVLWSTMSVAAALAADGDVKLKEVVVTATKTEKKLQDVTQSVTVVTGDEIQKLGVTNVAEVITATAGVMVNEQGPVGSLQSVTMRGSTYQQVLVLLDGKRLNSASAGGFDMSELAIPISAVERIEIVRGPSSSLYGSDAVGGVVNIITKKPGAPTTTLSGSLGAHGYTSASLYNAGRDNNTYYSLSLGKERSHGYRENSDSDQVVAGIKVGYDLDAASSLEATFDYTSKDIGVPGSLLFPPTLTSRQQTRNAIAGLQYLQRFSKGLDFTMRIYQNQEKIGFQNPDFAEFDTNKSVSSVAETQVTWLVNSFNAVTIGVEGRDDSLVNNSAGTHTESLTAEYLQDEINFGDSFIVVLGARNDSYSSFGSKISPRASARYLAVESGTILRASAGKSFQAPTLNDLYFKDAFGDTGNPDLRPETATEYEGGIEQSIGGKNSIKITAFKRKVQDLINWAAIPTNPAAVTPMNVDRARITGTETELHFVISSLASGSLNYTRMFPVDVSTGERIFSVNSQIPEMKFGGTLIMSLDTKTVLAFSGFRVKNYVQPGAEKWDYYTVDGKLTINIVSQKELKTDIFIAMKNMFNRKYETVQGYPMPPQELYGGITAQF